ncbi:nuclear movement protein nudc [Holotrichia oblita]|uniref:Nuclear movement protein nudc n=1 Tax=Holotrichia oblita TaxID=644536 RepID=A0ACB9SKU9_HOLOL|nr:nuclear movement protein nudc [Holotrichia oblita]
MDDNSHLDDTFFALLKDCKTLPTFLDAVFGFLNRRTDFYVTAKTPNSPVGLPEGLAERLVRNTFYKWKPKDLTIEGNVPEAVNEAVIETSVEDLKTEFNSSECYNGAVYENYSWSQTISEIDVIVKVPPTVTTKNLMVNISMQQISVKLKNENSIILEGLLCQKCKHTDAIWSFDKGKLEIHLEKAYEMWWDCFLQSEPKLDVAKLDCSRPFEDLSDEAQAKIQELTWNQERKRLGLPTSDEIKMHDKLKKAWNMEGSPFKEPYNPNTVIFN